MEEEAEVVGGEEERWEAEGEVEAEEEVVVGLEVEEVGVVVEVGVAEEEEVVEAAGGEEEVENAEKTSQRTEQKGCHVKKTFHASVMMLSDCLCFVLTRLSVTQ